MCMIDDAEPYYPAHYYTGVARREYGCGECGRTITRGERYERFAGMLEGHWDVWRTCEHCLWARGWLSDTCGGWVFAGVGEDLSDHWSEDTSYRCLDLGRRIIGIRRKWAKRDGTLRDLSTLVAV